MLTSGRNPEFQRIQARKSQVVYGMGLGIIILEDVYPHLPGDVGNASAYPFPIQYEIAEGVDVLCSVFGRFAAKNRTQQTFLSMDLSYPEFTGTTQ